MNKQKNMQHILHLTPHIGGGVGRVILNYLKQEKGSLQYSHEVACLDSVSEKDKAQIHIDELNCTESLHHNLPLLFKKVEAADIVLLHWWNHPLLFDLLVRHRLPACRLIMWSHVSGLSGTNVFTEKLLQYPDEFIFTTPISFESDVVIQLPSNIRNKLAHIWSTSGIQYIKKVGVKQEKRDFCIGYIGTVDYAKIHGDFVGLSNNINIKNKKIIVCGGGNEKMLSAEAEHSGGGEYFQFTGEVTDVNDYLSQFDVFGYPLSYSHYGTCDQVLAEAMAAGIVPVVFDNPMECSMVEHMKTGLIVKNKKEYAEAVELLHRNFSLRDLLSRNAMKFSNDFFSLKKMAIAWELTFERVMQQDKSAKCWFQEKDSLITATVVFLESLGNAGSPFINLLNAESKSEINLYAQQLQKLGSHPQWSSRSKGTTYQYLSFFPGDEQLIRFCNVMNSDL